MHFDQINSIVNIGDSFITCSEDTNIIVGYFILDNHESSVRDICYDAQNSILISTGGKEIICFYSIKLINNKVEDVKLIQKLEETNSNRKGYKISRINFQGVGIFSMICFTFKIA